GAQSVHALLDLIPEVLLWSDAVGNGYSTILNPQATDPAVYTYSPSTHQILRTRLTRVAQGINHVLLYGNNKPVAPPATSPTLIAEAIDAADTVRFGDDALVVRDMQVSLANAP